MQVKCDILVGKSIIYIHITKTTKILRILVLVLSLLMN